MTIEFNEASLYIYRILISKSAREQNIDIYPKCKLYRHQNYATKKVKHQKANKIAIKNKFVEV